MALEKVPPWDLRRKHLRGVQPHVCRCLPSYRQSLSRALYRVYRETGPDPLTTGRTKFDQVSAYGVCGEVDDPVVTTVCSSRPHSLGRLQPPEGTRPTDQTDVLVSKVPATPTGPTVPCLPGLPRSFELLSFVGGGGAVRPGGGCRCLPYSVNRPLPKRLGLFRVDGSPPTYPTLA